MKKTIKLTVVVALALGATSAFATNGSTLIGLGAKSRGMAGTSIGVSHGAESAQSNPALITSIKTEHEISFGGTLFLPDVDNAYGTGAPSQTSDADMSMIPEVSLATKVNENFYWGIGMWGTAGMGTDYRDYQSQMNMVTNLQLMQFGVPLAYTTNGLSIAIAPVLQYGSLDINYVSQNQDGSTTNKGMGVAQDLAFGVNFGIAYEIDGFTIGAVYKSQIDMTYNGYSDTIKPMTGNAYTNDDLSTPAEMGVGVSYVFEKQHTIAVDYKQIKWSEAKGYEDFAWDDQDVIALGYAYQADGWAVRLGYNYASSPINEVAANYVNATNGLSGPVINMFNLLGFPATITTHYAIGGSYNFSKTTSFDCALTYAPEESETYSVPDGRGGLTNMTTTHSQTALSFQLNYGF